MSLNKKRSKTMTALAVAIFTITGTYNAIVINSDSLITGSEVKFVKRLDEMYGVTKPGREYAAAKTWKKLSHEEVVQNVQIQQQQVQIVQEISVTDASPIEGDVPAAVQEDLNLNLVEVINPNKYQTGLALNQFSGSMTTSNGTIESLSVSLPKDENVSVSFAEMNGNVFNYDMNGEVYSGMMFQVDQTSYMVTFTNGPLEGTRLKFLNSSQLQEQNEALAADTGIDTGSFGVESAPAPESMLVNEVPTEQEMQAQGFNFDQQI